MATELAELQEERAACGGARARRPWELLGDRARRRQVLTLGVLGSAMALCGNDTVRPGAARGWARGCWSPRPGSEPPPAPQVYAYASAVFLEARVPPDKVQYAIVGTGSCELLTSCVSVSLAPPLDTPGCPPPGHRCKRGVGGSGTLCYVAPGYPAPH